MDLQETLLEMQRYGRPNLMAMRDGTWWITTDMIVNAAGASFKVESEMKHETPLAAASECYQRMMDILKGLSSTIKEIERVR